MTDDPISMTAPALSSPRAAVQELLSRLLVASTDTTVNTEDGLAFAVLEHAKRLRGTDPSAVTPQMIQATEMLTRGAKALADAATAAREVLDEELTALGADEITGKITVVDAETGEATARVVYVIGPDGTRYRLARGHTETKLFDNSAAVQLIATALRADYRPPAGTPAFLASQLGDAYEAGVRDGAAKARKAIGSGGGWLISVLEPLANRLFHAGDLAGAALLKAAIRTPKIRIKHAAKFEPVRAGDDPNGLDSATKSRDGVYSL